jgi:hypothetical protein
MDKFDERLCNFYKKNMYEQQINNEINTFVINIKRSPYTKCNDLFMADLLKAENKDTSRSTHMRLYSTDFTSKVDELRNKWLQCTKEF